jgi:hypothetical protein
MARLARSAFLIALVMTLVGCQGAGATPSATVAPTPAPSSPPASPSISGWLQTLIAQIGSEPVTNPPTAIYSYDYRGGTVYFRPSRCCDIRSELYDAGGALICQPDGGLTGKGDGRCPDFLAVRTNERVVWLDPRA